MIELQAMPAITPGQEWRHYEGGGLYTIIGIAHDVTTGNAVVVYVGASHHSPGMWVRPLDQFLGVVSTKGGKQARFTLERLPETPAATDDQP